MTGAPAAPLIDRVRSRLASVPGTGVPGAATVAALVREETGGLLGDRAVLATADLAVLVVPARLRAAAAARTLLESPAGAWSTALLVSRPVPGGLTRAQVADVVGRPVFAELAADRAAVVRSERGEPPSVAARAPLGLVSRQLLGRLPGRAA
ncbi:hypothetical protein [Modestobacter sp. SYSU DS0657]